LPVAIDGSNNGLQHISTLLKDIESAKKVNVLPTDRVEDIYKFIAETLKIELERERDKFEKVDKSSYKQVGKLYFKKIERFVKDIRINAINLIEKIEPLTANDVKNRKFSTTLYITGKEKSYLDEIETEIKSKNSNLSFDAIKKRIIRELNRDIDDLDMDVEDGNLNQNYEKRVIDYELIEESMIPILFENIKIDRKFVKKPVMTDSYGSSQRGKADDIFEEIYKLIYAVDIEDTKEAEEYIRKFSLFLAKKIEDAISKNSKASVNYEKFIKKIASYILKKDRHIYWYTPIGFKVQQFELKTKPAYINLKGNGKIKINIFQNEIDKREHKKGILPNFIHSLDATHLYKTINSVKKKGIDYFMTVHDSFATLPNDMDTLSQTLREEFINLYSEPILEHLIESINREFNMDINIKVPYVDKKEFNLEDIRDSKYFFA
jgi:DNA-directed RNA polymerase